MYDKTLDSLTRYAKEMGPHFPLNCGNLLVAGQYTLPLKTLHRYLKQGDTLLDWGCGGGHFSYLLLQEKFRLRSYAFTPHEALEVVQARAKSALNKTWQPLYAEGGDPVFLPYKSSSCDGVLSLGVLEHVRETGGNESASLKEIYRILKPGGHFFCFHFPNRYSWIEGASRLLNRLGIKKFYHHYLYTQKDIETLAKENCFTLLESGRYNLLPRRMLSLVSQKIGCSSTSQHLYNGLEKVLSLLFAPFSQNYFFVLKK